MSKTSAPWPFFTAPDGEGGPNEPTPEGRLLGAELARLTGEVDCCHDCACREGSDANGCGATALDFIKCALEGRIFWCHVREGELCAGYVAWRKGLTKAPTALIPCPECDGTGYHTDGMARADCRTCNGTGWATAGAVEEWEAMPYSTPEEDGRR